MMKGPRKFIHPAVITVLAFACAATPAFAALPETSTPQLRLERTIRTTPFVNASVSMKDAEGSAYVPSDRSLWFADDNARRVYEVDPDTGALKRVIRGRRFENAPRFGGGPAAGRGRTADFESMAYDAERDVLYVFAGPCCSTSAEPTAFRLMRRQGRFRVQDHQPLAGEANYTAAAWNPGDGRIYVGHRRKLRTYDYVSNTAGTPFRVPSGAGVLGAAFSPDGADLFVTTNAETLRRIDWAGMASVPGWTFDLTPFGVRDARAVSVVGDRFYVLDGTDGRPRGNPLRYAVFVFEVMP
jgi:hypothetical protein